MNNWNLLPPEILEIVFYHIGSEMEIFDYPDVSAFPTKDLLQCQLTCKNWESIARSTFYKVIILDRLEQSDEFFRIVNNSDMGPLVNYIILNFYFPCHEEPESTIILFQQLASSFPNLKRISCAFSFDPVIFKTIESERSKNNYLKLEALPDLLDTYSKKYYTDTACLFQQSLRELVIYDHESKLFQDKEKLKSFSNLDTLIFRFQDRCNLFAVDQYVSKCPTVKYVQIENESTASSIYKTNHGGAKVNSSTDTCPQVERVNIDKTYFNIRIYSYLMNAFPNLKRFSLKFKKHDFSSGELPTDIALQYLHYLIKISDVSVKYIPVENINDTMMGLYDGSNTIKKLVINYQKNNCSFLAIKKNTSKADKNVKISVYYKVDELIVLPRTGLIEKSGNNLQSLRIDMAIKSGDMFMVANGPDKPDIVSYIMSQCPNLKVIKLWHAFLYSEDCSLLEKKPLSREIVYLVESLIHPSFFPGLSYYAPYIAKLRINNCKFINDERNDSYISIDMPNTEIGSIDYQDMFIKKYSIYLMLATTLDDKTVWYHGIENKFSLCKEVDYKKSLKDEISLSIFIRCKSISKISLESFSFGLSIDI